MPKLSWRSALLVLILTWGLAACGNGDETGAPGNEESVETTQPEAQTTTEDQPLDDPVVEEEMPAQSAAEDTLPDDTDTGLTASGEGVDAPAEDVEANTDTETTRDDVDALIEETERRFDEASRRIDEQFEAAEQAPMELEPMDSSTDLMPSEDSMDEIGDASTLDDEPLHDTDVDAFLKEQERRFEEAERRLEQEFDEIEQGGTELEPIENDTMP